MEIYQGALDSLPLGSPLDTISISSNYGIRRTSFRWWMAECIQVLILKGTRWDTVFATGNGSSQWPLGTMDMVNV